MTHKLVKNGAQSLMLFKKENQELKIHNRQLTNQLQKAQQQYNILHREFRSATQFLWIAARQQEDHRLKIPDSLQASSLKETSILRLEKDPLGLSTYLIAETEEENKENQPKENQPKKAEIIPLAKKKP